MFRIIYTFNNIEINRGEIFFMDIINDIYINITLFHPNISIYLTLT